MMRKNRQGRGWTAIFIVMTVLLSFVLLFECVYIYSELTREHISYYAEEKDYINNVNYEQYYRIYTDASYDSDPERDLSTTETEIRALGYYYQAATLYKAYLAVEDAESAAKQLARMDRYRAEAGSYASETDKIDERLGI